MTYLARNLHYKGAGINDFDLCIFGVWSLSDKEAVSARDVALTTRSQWKGCSTTTLGSV